MVKRSLKPGRALGSRKGTDPRKKPLSAETRRKLSEAARKPKRLRSPRNRALTWKLKFLRAYGKCLNISEAADAIGKSKRRVNNERRSDKEFGDAVEAIWDAQIDRMERQMAIRATDGWDEPVFHQGEQCGSKKRFSSAVSIFMLRKNRPEKYDRHEDTPVIVLPETVAKQLAAMQASVPQAPQDEDDDSNRDSEGE